MAYPPPFLLSSSLSLFGIKGEGKGNFSGKLGREPRDHGQGNRALWSLVSLYGQIPLLLTLQRLLRWLSLNQLPDLSFIACAIFLAREASTSKEGTSNKSVGTVTTGLSSCALYCCPMAITRVVAFKL